MNILQKIKEVFLKMFHRDIQEKYKSETLSSAYINALDLWQKMYIGKAPWSTRYIESMRLETGICRELANVTLSEMTVSASQKNINMILQNAVDNIDIPLQKGLAMGSFIIRPLGNGKFEFISAEKFIPLKFDTLGKLLSVVLVSELEENGNHYTRLEKHELSPLTHTLTISNSAFFSKSSSDIGKPIPLSAVPEWANLPESVSYNVDRMDLGYFRTPIANDIDGTQAPVSIYQTSVDLIKEADKLQAQLNWEFESGERVVHVDDRALAPMDRRKFNDKDGDNKVMPNLNERLYRGLNLMGMSGSDTLYKEYSPQFREQNILNGLNSVLRKIEFNCGLAYGDLSEMDNREKTAEEIKTSKQRKYNTVNAIQRKLKECIEDFVWSLCFYERCVGAGAGVVISFNDSILTSEKEEKAQDKEDVAMGIMSIVEYRMKWYNETEAVAKKALKSIMTADYESNIE